MIMQKAILFTATLALACGVSMADDVDVTNDQLGSGILLNSNGGLFNTGFDSVSNNGVSLWLRVRDKAEDPGTKSGGVFQIDSGVALAENYRIDFQFTPKTSDIVPSGTSPSFTNYQLQLEVDTDPTAGVSFEGDAKIVFDDDDSDGQWEKSPNGDIDSRDDDTITGNTSGENAFESGDDQQELLLDGSWDDGDSLVIDGVTERGGLTVDFNNANYDYVVVNSWKPEWAPGVTDTPTATGLYDVRLTVFDASGTTQIAQLDSQYTIPEPTTALIMAGSGLALMIRRRRKVA